MQGFGRIVWTMSICMASLFAASGFADTPNALLTYTGSDREAKVVAAAKKEGELTFYTSIAQPDIQALVGPFQQKYGIKVNVWRAGDEEVLQRTVTEARAHRFNVDAVHFGSSFLEALHREKLLQPVDSPVQADLIPVALPAHHEWADTMLSVWVQAYNTNLVKKADLPKTYAELLDPKWRGKIAIEAKSVDWFSTVVTQMGEEKGMAYFRELVRKNHVTTRRGNSLLKNFVVAGEVPVALEIYNYMPAQAKRNGAPIDWFLIQPAAARANGIAIMRHAQHPMAALLFYDYLLSADAQKVLAAADYVPTNKTVASPMQGLPVTIVDPATVIDQSAKWNSAFSSIFLTDQGS
jgi:iron(III) transport system substrate-binding protein